ncbi:hypothetical protein QJQ45_023562 [Haematococcus lacustris]|nr:hypothetical protein QJQ45_023562 [Haematococcus lacustris]
MQRDEEWPPRLSSTPDLQSPCEICSTTDDSTTAPIPFITHKVSKWDTLAGVAVKYNVSVADIKRANGLLSDSAMYALETIQVPTKLLPLGEELQVLFAQVASGLGRDPVLDAEANLQPASAACARVARTLHIVNDLPNCQAAGPQAGLPWWCQCGACDEDSYDHACRQNRPKGGDVELIECSPHDELMRRGDTPGSNTRMHERMRRRPVNQDDAQDAAAPGTSSQQESDNEPGSGEDEDKYSKAGASRHCSQQHNSSSSSRRLKTAGHDWWQQATPPHRTLHHVPASHAAVAAAGTVADAASAAVNSLLRRAADLGYTLGSSSLVQKLRAVANQSALAGESSSQHWSTSWPAAGSSGGDSSLPRSYNAASTSPVKDQAPGGKGHGMVALGWGTQAHKLIKGD